MFGNSTTKRDEAQELMWEAMDQVAVDEAAASEMCHRALDLYPHCVDALTMLANLECDLVADFVAALRAAVEAGRKDLGKQFFKEKKGYFWGLIETRPFMRAMGELAGALVELGHRGCHRRSDHTPGRNARAEPRRQPRHPRRLGCVLPASQTLRPGRRFVQ